jgi:hypothetical protein
VSKDQGVRVPKVATLDGFSEAVGKIEGIFIKDVLAVTVLEVCTQDSVYTLVVDPVSQKVLIKDDKYLPELVECPFFGSVFQGGANTKIGWIGIGMCMNFKTPQNIPPETSVTSPVKSLRIIEGTKTVH